MSVMCMCLRAIALHLCVCERATRSQISARQSASKSLALTRNFQINYLWFFFIKYIPRNCLIWFWHFHFHTATTHIRYIYIYQHLWTAYKAQICVLCCSRGFGHSVDHVKRALITHNVHERSKINRLQSLSLFFSLCLLACLSFTSVKCEEEKEKHRHLHSMPTW